MLTKDRSCWTLKLSACHSGRVLPDDLSEVACGVRTLGQVVVILGCFSHPDTHGFINPAGEIGSRVEVFAVGSTGAIDYATMDDLPDTSCEGCVPCQRCGTILCSSRVVGGKSLVRVVYGISGGDETGQVGDGGKDDGCDLHSCVF